MDSHKKRMEHTYTNTLEILTTTVVFHGENIALLLKKKRIILYLHKLVNNI